MSNKKLIHSWEAKKDGELIKTENRKSFFVVIHKLLGINYCLIFTLFFHTSLEYQHNSKRIISWLPFTNTDCGVRKNPI